MAKRHVSIQPRSRPSGYEILIAHGHLAKCGDWARNCLAGPAAKIAMVSNAKIYGLYGEKVRKALKNAGFEVCTFLMKDGERYKNFRSLENALEFFGQNNLTRADAVLALGGGVVGDLAGFAASIYLRGIPFLQVPTTLLAMIDSSVGGKTAVNTSYGKNLIGTFYQPKGVLIDIETLKTLPRRELTAGFCESVKQGAIAGRDLFDLTGRILENYPIGSFRKFFPDEGFLSEMEDLVREQVSFKAGIVRQDETEDIQRSDIKSRKILNFGHTLAHALEKATGYKYFKHGEAVGYGILYAAELSKTLGLLEKNEINLLYDVVHRAGKLPDMGNIDAKDIFEAFKFDKKSTGTSLQWILLKGIGEPVIISDNDISQSNKENALKKILQR
jgi:3-dehydroquinate synthase